MCLFLSVWDVDPVVEGAFAGLEERWKMWCCRRMSDDTGPGASLSCLQRYKHR